MADFESNLYCDFTGTGTQAMAGKDIVVCIFDATGANLMAVAGQQGLTINREKEMIEVNSKTTAGGWKDKVAGLKNWSIELDGLYVRGDASHQALEKAYSDDTQLCVKVVNTKTKKAMFGGLALVGEYPIEAPYDESVTYSITLEGCGALTDLSETEAPQMPAGVV